MKGKVTLGKKKFCPQNGQDFENFLDLEKFLGGSKFFFALKSPEMKGKVTFWQKKNLPPKWSGTCFFSALD